MDKREFIESGLMEMYVLGLCTDRQRQRVESMLKTHPELSVQLHEMQTCMERYAEKYAMSPPADLKESVMSDAKTGTANAYVGAKASARKWAIPLAASLAGIAILACLFLYNKNNALQREQIALTASLETLSTDCETIRNQNERLIEYYQFVQDPKTAHVLLAGTSNAPVAKAMVYWNRDQQTAYFHALNLPDISAEEQLQIWADVEGEMISLGTLEITDSMQFIEFIDRAESLNITIEPKGGNTHPTVERLVMNSPV